MVEILLRQRLDPEDFEVASAGVQGWREAPVDSMVVLELERLGARADGFASRALEAEMVDDADLILTATREHRSEVLSRHPNALRRTFTLREFAALVEDMIGVTSPAEMVAAAYAGAARPETTSIWATHFAARRTCIARSPIKSPRPWVSWPSGCPSP